MRRICRWKKLMRFVVLMRPWYSRVVSDAGLSVADAGNVNAVSKKPKRGKRRHSRGLRNAKCGEIVVNFADVSMT